MQSLSTPATNEVSLGLAEPLKKEVGEAITSLGFPYFAVPVAAST